MANRFFYAVPLPQTIRETLGGVQQSAGESATRAMRIVRRENLHITLHFIGDLQDSAGLESVLRRPLGSAFEIQIGGCGFFPSPRHPRVGWIGVRDRTGGLIRLYREIGRRLSTVGVALERRELSPHITIGYFRRRATPAVAKQAVKLLETQVAMDLGSFVVERVVLLNSRTAPGGSIYTVVKELTLEPVT